jgi:DNA-binding transcriptional LysR family regulator
LAKSATDRIDWDDLRLCLAVARGGTLSAAGERLGLSHSTLLRRIAALEGKLGTTLFVRSSNGYLPNDAGKRLCDAAALMELQVSDAIATVHGHDAAMSGVIRFAVPDLSGQALMGVVRRFTEAHPDIEIVFEVSQKPSGLTLGDCHCALVLTAEAPIGQVGNPIGPVAFAAYCSRRSVEGIGGQNRQPLAWVGLLPSLHHLPVGRFDDQLSQGYARRHLCSSVAMQLAAIQRGIGAGVLACALGDSDPDLVRCSPILTDDSLTLWLLHRKELRGNARITAFHRHLLKHLQRGRARMQGNTPLHPQITLSGGTE